MTEPRRQFYHFAGGRRHSWRGYTIERSRKPAPPGVSSRQQRRRAAFRNAWRRLHEQYSPQSMPRRVRRRIALDVSKRKAVAR